MVDNYSTSKALHPFIFGEGIDSRDEHFLPEHRNVEEIQAWLRGEPESLAFSEFWDDLTQAIGGGTTLKTLDNHTSFEVLLNSRLKSITLNLEDSSVFLISEAALIDLWHYVRKAGYCIAQFLPSGLDEYANYVLSILAQLSYLRPITLFTREDHDQRQIGLQLIPQIETLPNEIITASKIVELK